MRLTRLALIALTLVLWTGAALAASPRVGSFGRGAWSWFGDPRAVAVSGQNGKTFVGWIDWSGRVIVGAYDPSFGVLRKKRVGWLFHDDHGSPSILVEPDHRLTVFWSGHNGTEMFYRSTLRPEDITAWGPLREVPARLAGRFGYTYPQPVRLPAEHNKLYLFWRGADWGADYATRTPNGRWGAAHRLIVSPGQRPYLKVDSDRAGTIALAFTTGHPRDVLTSIYYAAYRRGWLWTAGGRRIERLGSGTLSPGRADLVYDAAASNIPAWVWDTALDSHHRPVIVYATFPSISNHAYWYARWDGHRWVSHFLTNAGPSISPTSIEYQYSGGIALDHGNPSIVYLSRHAGNGWEIERWTTADGGYAWRHRVVVPSDGTDNVRPVVPRGSRGGPISLLWMRGDYRTYSSYRTTIAYLK